MADRVVKYVFRGDITDLKAKMTAAGASVSKFADDATRADKEGAKFRQGLSAVGDTAGKIGLAAAAGLGAVVVATANFDAKMSEVSAATGETASNMDKLREAAIQAGADTAFSASEAADGITELAKAGVSTADILGGGLQGALDLAAAGQIDVGEAAEYSAKAMTQFNLAGDQVPHVADLLAAAAGKAVGEVGDFGQALNQAGLVASQTGLTIEDTVGTLAAFAQAGLQGSDAGTAFKSMLQRLQNPLGQGAKTMSALGISAYDAQGNFVGITDVAEQLRQKLSQLTPAQRDAAMAQMFGADAVRAASILYKEGAEGIQGWIDQTNDSGFAAEQAAAKLDNLKGDLEALKGSLETALIGAGSGSQGPLRSLVQGLTAAINKFNELSPAAQGTATALLGITAVTGGGLWFGAKVVQGVANTREALENLGVSAGKAGGALKALGYTAAGITALVAAGQAIKALEDSALDAVPGVESLTQSLLNLRDAEVARQFASEVGDIGVAIDRVTDAGLRAQGFDFMHGMGRQMSALATGAEELSSKFGDYESLAEAEQDLRALDAALANIVSSGSPEAAADALDNLAAAQGLSAAQVDALRSKLPQYEEALAGADNAATLAASSQEDFAAATDASAAAAQEEADALRESIDAMRDKRSEAIRAMNAEINYEASLDDARKSLKENGKTLDITTEKGRANRSALLGLASAWNDQSDAVKNGKGARRDAIREFVELAEKMGMGREKARDLARELYEIPSKRVVDVDVNTANARAQIAGFMNALPSTHTVSIVAQRRGNWSGSGPGLATGGPVVGPGTATSDSIPAYLSNGEYVIKAAAVQHYGLETFDRLNAMRFADGGPVSRAQRFADGGRATASFDYDRLASIVRSGDMRPIVVEDRSGSPARTGQEVARQIAWAGRV